MTFDSTKLTEAGREELALALLLLKDFKCQGRMDFDVTLQILKLSVALGVDVEYNKLMSKIPPMRIEPR